MNLDRQEKLFLWQRFLHVEVFRKSEDLLQADLFFQETSREVRLQVELSIKDFTVKNAVLERTRPAAAAIKPLSLLFLGGRSIYMKEAKKLKKALLEWGETQPLHDVAAAAPSPAEREHFADLFMELIANVIQVEVFILPERGIPSLAAYDRYFNEVYGEECVLYTKLRGSVPEFAYTQGQDRSHSLFSRHRSICVLRQQRPGTADSKHGAGMADSFTVHGHLADSFHEMALALDVAPYTTPPYLIERAHGNFLRLPNPVCGDAVAKLQELPGKHLVLDNKKELLTAVTGPAGCSHLGDLVIEAARTLQEFKKIQQHF